MQVISSTNNYNIKPIRPAKPPIFKSKFDKFAGMLSYDTANLKAKREVKKIALYNNIISELGKIEPNTIDKIASHYQDIPRKVLYSLMNRLTTYSNISSIVKLRDKLNQLNIGDFNRFDQDYIAYTKRYRYKKRNYSKANCPEELIPKFKFFPELSSYTNVVTSKLKFVHSKLLNLNFVLSYFFTRYDSFSAKCPLNTSANQAIILDERILSYLEELVINNPKKLNKLKESENIKFIYLKNMENTYNIFEQHQDFEELLQKNIKKYKDIQKNYPQKETNDIFELMFDRKSLKRAEKLGINPIIIDITETENPNPTTIANNMTPIIPDFKTFDMVLDNSMDLITYNPLNQNKLLDVLNERFIVYSPKSIGKKLQQLKIKIEKSVREVGKDTSKIFYLIPKTQKSFALINYMYQKINEIPLERYLYWDNSKYDVLGPSIKNSYNELENSLPDGSTVVILDDIIVSGDSILSTQFKYLAKREKNNFEMIFASLYSTDRAEGMLNLKKEEDDVTNNDRIISVDKQNIKVDKLLLTKIDLLKKNTHIMLPYNAPDNNSQHFRELVQLFYPEGENFVQETWEVFL